MLNALISTAVGAQLSAPALRGYMKHNLNPAFELAALLRGYPAVTRPGVTPGHLAPSPARPLG